MPFNPNEPQNGEIVDADALRNQFNGLKDLIDAVPAGPAGPQEPAGADGAPGPQGDTGLCRRGSGVPAATGLAKSPRTDRGSHKDR